MTKRALKKLQRKYEEAGSIKNRLNLLQLELPLIARDILRMKELMVTRREHYRRMLETWYGTVTSGDPRPSVIPEHIRMASKYFWSAMSGIVGEATLTSWIFSQMGIQPWWGVLIAVLSAIFFETIVTFGLKNVDKPRETLRRIKHLVLIPSAIIFGISFTLLLLARTVSGTSAVALVQAFNISLWTITLGLLGIVGASLAASEVWSWSKKDQQDYDAIEIEEAQTRSVRDVFTRELSTLLQVTQSSAQNQAPAIASTSQAHVQAPPNGAGAINNGVRANRRAKQAIKIVPTLLLFLLPLFHGCTAATPKTASQQRSSEAQTNSHASLEESELNIYVDTSLSVEDSVLQSLVKGLISSIPTIAERWNVLKVNTYIFAQDGWNCALTFSTQLPGLKLSAPPKVDKGEIGALLPNISGSLDEQEQKQSKQRDEASRKLYHEEIEQLLSELSQKSLLPQPNSPEPHCTDLNGLFHRLATPSGGRLQLALVITDGAENCKSGLRPISLPASAVGLVVVLLPEKRNENKTHQQGYEQFKDRKAQLSAALPWASIIPFFNNEYNAAFSEALIKTASPSKNRLAQTSTSETLR